MDTPQQTPQSIVQGILKSATMDVGDIWYLVTTKWWRNWMDTDNPHNPGPIDNHPLLTHNQNSNTQTLIKGLIENESYTLLPQEAWKHIVSRYGGGPEIARKVISVATYTTPKMEVEVYPLELQCLKVEWQDPMQQQPFVITCSKVDTVKQLRCSCRRCGSLNGTGQLWLGNFGQHHTNANSGCKQGNVAHRK